MISHLSYAEERYTNAGDCLAGIRTYIDRGWELVQLRGPTDGPFLVVFRLQEDSR